jgi:hypothetical protein
VVGTLIPIQLSPDLSTVHILPVADPDDLNEQVVVVYLVNDSKAADADAVCAVFASHRHAKSRMT